MRIYLIRLGCKLLCRRDIGRNGCEWVYDDGCLGAGGRRSQFPIGGWGTWGPYAGLFLGIHAVRIARVLAAKFEDSCQDHADIASANLDRLGEGAEVLL
jgi:hypothetical protein